MAISKCDEKIAKFEELLKQMRSDLYGSLETISDKVCHTVNTVNSTTKKKGVPKIISNIQLVPPRTAPRKILNVEESDYCSEGEGWTEVRSRRGKKSVKIDMINNTESVEAPTPVVNDRVMRRLPSAAPIIRRRASRAAAVSIKPNTDNVTLIL